MNKNTSVSDLLDGKKLIQVFRKYDEKYFNQKLKDVKVLWSDRMTLCTGKTYLSEMGNFKFCSIYLSKPLLMQRSIEDSINTLLHEMIHAYLFLTKDKVVGEGHGEDFKNHMVRINAQEGCRIKIRHTFLKEVNKFRVHVYKCDGPCRFNKPFYGVLRRAILRPPGPEDKWWTKHSMECGGTFHKISDSGLETDAHSSAARPPRRKTVPMMIQRDLPRGEGSKSFKFVKREVNPRYESKVKRISSRVQKYIQKYIDYNNSRTSSLQSRNHLNSTFHQDLKSTFRQDLKSTFRQDLKSTFRQDLKSTFRQDLKSTFRQDLNSNIEKYIAKVRVSLKHRK